MTESVDDGDVMVEDDVEHPVMAGGSEEMFGSYSVLSPGVEIVLEGRQVSAPAAD